MNRITFPNQFEHTDDENVPVKLEIEPSDPTREVILTVPKANPANLLVNLFDPAPSSYK